MKYIQLNNTDLNISPICLGTAGFGDKSDLEKSFEILNAFVRAGIQDIADDGLAGHLLCVLVFFLLEHIENIKHDVFPFLLGKITA